MRGNMPPASSSPETAVPDSTGRPCAGWFVTFEGPEGAGKTTQIGLLAEALRARGHTVTRTREPGGDPVGEKVRELLLHRDEIGAEAELLLFAAARAQNVRSVVRPALEAGHVVLCDRYTDSTLAYQGYGRGLPADLLARVNAFATGGLVPDRTILLDLPPAEGLARQRAEEQNRLDRERMPFHERVREGFLAVAREEPERLLVIDAARPVEAVATDVQRAVFALLG
jgi:dTMP kinase